MTFFNETLTYLNQKKLEAYLNFVVNMRGQNERYTKEFLCFLVWVECPMRCLMTFSSATYAFRVTCLMTHMQVS